MPFSEQNQFIHPVLEHQKTDLILHLLENSSEITPTVIYVRTRETVHALASTLNNSGIPTASIHGNKKQSLREAALKDLAEQKILILVTTCAASRGKHITGTHNIINYDFPELNQDYLDRLATENPSGNLTTLINSKTQPGLTELQTTLGYEIHTKNSPTFDYDTHPPQKGSSRNKTPKRGARSKPLQNKKQKLRPRKGR